MILLIDNYDSFVHNLARYVRELGGEAVVRRNDELTLDDIARMAPSHIMLSPGPCSPAEAGISTDVIRRFGASTPILGVCLGHQCIAAAYGGDVVRAGRPVHGRTSLVEHDGTSIFEGLPSPLPMARYHSLAIRRASLPPELRVIASSKDDGEIMAVVHREHPVIGLQGHPESAASEYGYAMLDRFLHGDRARLRELPPHADGAREAADETHRRDPQWRAPSPVTGDEFVPPPVELVQGSRSGIRDQGPGIRDRGSAE
jgi:anthranilate synthase/aminodeoxychorismate synthase-like glutamine amidotransferase